MYLPINNTFYQRVEPYLGGPHCFVTMIAAITLLDAEPR